MRTPRSRGLEYANTGGGHCDQNTVHTLAVTQTGVGGLCGAAAAAGVGVKGGEMDDSVAETVVANKIHGVT